MMKIVYLIMIFGFCFGQVFGQRIVRNEEPSEPQPIKKKEVHQMVKTLADSLAKYYVIEEKAKMLKDKLLQELTEGKHNQFSEKQALARKLSEDLRAWSNDKHFNITLAGQRMMMPSSYDHFAKQNYFFDKMEHLDGNISYIKFDRFIPPSNLGGLVVSAMLFACNSDAVIIDLRDNMGGSPATVGLLAGFFMEEPKVLTVSEVRWDGEKHETWSAETEVLIKSSGNTLSTSDLEKLKKLPVYILTSDYTFSAAEAFSSGLQGHKRATIVGEKTGGGGHGIRPFALSQGFQAFIPFVRVYHPVTKKGWEVVGVQPDIPCPANDALRQAQIAILKELQKKPDADSKLAEYLKKLED